MKAYRSFLIISAFTISSLSLMVSSCKEDEPPSKPKLSFSQSTKTINEADGVIEIKMKLDKGAFEDVTITYELSGTALDKVTAGTTKAYDYEIKENYLETEIVKGDSIGIIKLTLFSDLDIEEDETITISIKDTDSENIEITRNDDIKITLKQEDGMVVALEWGTGVGEKYVDVDMDLFLWAKGSDSNLGLTNIASANSGFASPEFFFLPTKVLNDGQYGLSCTYYEGTVSPMNFSVSFVKLVAGVYKTPTVKKATYTLVNINPWFTSDVDPALVLTFDKTSGDFTNFSNITVPAQGSRQTSSGLVSSYFKKGDDSKIKPLSALQKLK